MVKSATSAHRRRGPRKTRWFHIPLQAISLCRCLGSNTLPLGFLFQMFAPLFPLALTQAVALPLLVGFLLIAHSLLLQTLRPFLLHLGLDLGLPVCFLRHLPLVLLLSRSLLLFETPADITLPILLLLSPLLRLFGLQPPTSKLPLSQLLQAFLLLTLCVFQLLLREAAPELTRLLFNTALLGETCFFLHCAAAVFLLSQLLPLLIFTGQFRKLPGLLHMWRVRRKAIASIGVGCAGREGCPRTRG